MDSENLQLHLKDDARPYSLVDRVAMSSIREHPRATAVVLAALSAATVIGLGSALNAQGPHQQFNQEPHPHQEPFQGSLADVTAIQLDPGPIEVRATPDGINDFLPNIPPGTLVQIDTPHGINEVCPEDQEACVYELPATDVAASLGALATQDRDQVQDLHMALAGMGVGSTVYLDEDVVRALKD